MTRYSPGDWYGVVTPAGVALLPRAVPMSAVERVWMDLRAGGGLGALIDGLVGAFGTSLSRLPEFGVVALSPDGEVRVAMRGQVTARLWLLGTAEPTLVNGTGVTTWNERLWTGVGRAELWVGDIATRDDEDLLPVVDGVLCAGSLHVAILDFDTQPPPERTDEPDVADESSEVDEGAEGPLAVVPETDTGGDEMEADRGDGSLAVRTEPVAVEPTRLEPAAPEAGPVIEPNGASETALPDLDPDPETLLPGPETVPPEPEPTPGHTTMIEAGPDAPPESDYDRLLFGETMMASAESAAVRINEDEPADSPKGPEPADPALAKPGASIESPVPPLPPVPPPLRSGLIAGIPSFGAPPPPPPAARPVPPPPPPPVDPSAWADHDGETVMVDQLRAAMGARPSPSGPSQPHPRMLVPGQPPVTLDRSAVVGSRPRLTRVQVGSVPQLVTVQSPNGEISRSHVEIRVEHAAVLAVDLNSTNGTVLLRTGADPMRLHPGEAYMLVSGDRVDLGDGVTLAFEGLT